MWDVFLDTIIDGIKLLPFLYITYLLLEILEHKTGGKLQKIVKEAGKAGPFWGGLFGAFPQCGFSAAASTLYAGRIVSLGTLIAIYLSTSDEMLPVLISEKAPISLILEIIGAKIVIGITTGFIVDLIFKKKEEHEHIHEICEHEHCHCEQDGVIKSSIIHTLQIFGFILAVSLVLNILLYFVGEEVLENFILNTPFIGPVITGIVGLIPNCAASVVITQLYLKGLIGVGSMMAGLLVGAGVGFIVLFRMNRDLKENFKILGITYVSGVLFGIVIELLSRL